jgi:hypothetical protein
MPRCLFAALLLWTSALAQVTTGQHTFENQENARTPDVNSFVPKRAQLIKQLRISFDPSDKPSVALAYATKVNDYDFSVGVRVLEYRKSGWVVSYREIGDVGTPGDPLTIEKVESAAGKEGLVVVSTFSGAGTATAWHAVTRRGPKIVELNPTTIRDRALRRRGYEFQGYNTVTVKGDSIFEEISGYSHGEARCCPDRPPLKLGFKFTGSALQLISVETMPFKPN